MTKMLLRPSEVAAALGISRTTLYQLFASGDLPWVRVGRRVRVNVVDLNKWIEERARRGAVGKNGEAA